MQQKDSPMVADLCVPDRSAGFATNPVKKKTANSPVVSDLHEPDCRTFGQVQETGSYSKEKGIVQERRKKDHQRSIKKNRVINHNSQHNCAVVPHSVFGPIITP